MMSSAPTQPKAKRRRVVDSTATISQPMMAHQQQAMSRAQEATASHLMADAARARAEAQARASAQVRAAELQVQRSMLLATSAAQLTSAQLQAAAAQYHIPSSLHSSLPMRTVAVAEPPVAHRSSRRSQRSAPKTTSSSLLVTQAAHAAGGTSQHAYSKTESTKAVVNGRSFTRLPGQIYPVTGKSQQSGQSSKDSNMPVMHRQPQGMDYGAMGNMRSMLPQAPMIPPNPDVRLKRLPFYDVLGELMKPSSLIPKNSGRMQDTLFVFHLTPQQAQDITMSRDFRPGAKCEYTVQVQIRFCLIETTCEQADTFPSQIQVRVNNKPATLPNVIPTNKPNVEPKRPGRPVDITNLCRLSPTVSNAIQITWAADFTRNFCMSIYLVKKLSSEILLTRLRQFGNRHADHTKALIKEKLSQDPDSEISTTSLKISLMCPLGKMRMTIPCRPSSCTHLQCFDAHTFLLMNERKPTWNCPVCDKPSPYDKLIIDGYFVEILKSNPNTNDIVFHEDGSWSPMKPQKESNSQVILTPSSKKPASNAPSETPSLSVSASSRSSPATAAPPTPTDSPAPASGSAPPAANKGPVIDLTLDSSDEDDDDAVIPSDPAASPPVINLDAPSPASVAAASSPVVLSSSSHSSSPTGSSHHGNPAAAGLSSRTPPQASPPSNSDNAVSSPAARNNQSPSSALQNQALNLEAMSDADFDEFLKGLSWGV